MKHLSIEEITEYVEINKVNEENLNIISRVNNHIRECSECNEKIVAWETVYSEIRKVALQIQQDDFEQEFQFQFENAYNEKQTENLKKDLTK